MFVYRMLTAIADTDADDVVDFQMVEAVERKNVKITNYSNE